MVFGDESTHQRRRVQSENGPMRPGRHLRQREAAGEESEQPLPDQGQQVVIDLGGLSRVPEQLGHGGRPAEALIQLTERHQAGVGTDEPAVEIGDDGLSPAEVEGKLLWRVCQAKASLPRMVAGFQHPHSTRLRRPLLCAGGQPS